MSLSTRIALTGLLFAVIIGPLRAAPLSTQATAMPQPASPSYPAPTNSVAPVALPCERACMEGLADRFLKALASHNPQSLPLAGGIRYTEMG